MYFYFRNSNSDAKTVEIIPVSLLTQKNSAEWEGVGSPSKNTFRIVVSHLPVMPTQNRFVLPHSGGHPLMTSHNFGDVLILLC